MKTNFLKMLPIVLSSTLLLFACGGGRDGASGSSSMNSGSVVKTGYAVDDYIVGGTVNIYKNNTSSLIETTTTGDYGKFQWSSNVKGVVRVEVTGGYEDIDGLSATTNDHIAFTKKMILLMNADTISAPAIISPITTGIANYANGDITKYNSSVNALNPSLQQLVVTNDVRDDFTALIQRLSTISATTRAVGYDRIVTELSDDGKFNNSTELNTQQVVNVASALYSQGGISPITDAGLRTCISDNLGKPISAITKSDLSQVTDLRCTDYNIRSVAGIDALISLKSFISSNSDISDISPFAKISTLNVLSIKNNRVAKIAPLFQAKFSRLELQIADNCVTDMSLLSGSFNISYQYGDPNHQYSTCYKNDANVLIFTPYVTGTGIYTVMYKTSYNPNSACAIDWGDGSDPSQVNCDARIYRITHSYSSTPAKPVSFLVNGALKKQASFPSTNRMAEWLSWDGKSLSPAGIEKVGSNISNLVDLNAIYYRLPKPLDGDKISFEFRAMWAQSPGAYSGRDIAFAMGNIFSSGKKDSKTGLPIPTRLIQANFLTNGWNDSITTATDVGTVTKYSGTTNSTIWHKYRITSSEGVVGVYVDDVLKYTQPYTGKIGYVDGFSGIGLAKVIIDPASFKAETNSSVFTIQANNSSGVFFTAPTNKTTCNFKATGLWSESGSPRYGPNGTPSYPSGLFSPSMPLGSLVAFKKNSTKYLIGADATIPVTAGESIGFIFNDISAYSDNLGSVTVTATCQ